MTMAEQKQSNSVQGSPQNFIIATTAAIITGGAGGAPGRPAPFTQDKEKHHGNSVERPGLGPCRMVWLFAVSPPNCPRNPNSRRENKIVVRLEGGSGEEDKSIRKRWPAFYLLIRVADFQSLLEM